LKQRAGRLEKEALVHQLDAEGKAIAAIARLVGLTRKTVYKAIGQRQGWNK
jgi:hypothetical protein